MKIGGSFVRIFILLLLSFIFLMAGNNIISLTNPDEVFYAGTAKEMAQQKTWMVPYLFGQPQFEKPVLLYWCLRIGFAVFGISNFAARFFPALFAILGVIAIYIFCARVYSNQRKAFLCALILMSSGLYVGLARTVFTDMIFSVFILLSLLSFYLGYAQHIRKNSGILLFFVFSALAVLTKGPLGFLIPLVVIFVFLAVKRKLNYLFCRYSLVGFILFLLIAVPWYYFMIKKFGNSFTSEFFYNDHIRRILTAEHNGNDTWYFYPLSAVFCMFPWSVFTAASFIYLLRKLKIRTIEPIYLFLLCWIMVVLVVFQIAHSKLVSYIFPLFPALAVLTGDFIYETALSNKRLIYFLSVTTLLIFLLLLVGLELAAIKYPMYAGSPVFRHSFIAFFILAIFVQTVILKRKIAFFPYVLAFNLITILFFSFLNHKTFDDHVSSKQAGDYLKNNHHANGVILCSKFFARGIRFYTDKEVAVISLGGSKFFSPHPISFLDTDEKVSSFLVGQQLTYAVLNKSSLSDMERIAKDGRFNCEALEKFGDEYIVAIKAGKH